MLQWSYLEKTLFGVGEERGNWHQSMTTITNKKYWYTPCAAINSVPLFQNFIEVIGSIWGSNQPKYFRTTHYWVAIGIGVSGGICPVHKKLWKSCSISASAVIFHYFCHILLKHFRFISWVLRLKYHIWHWFCSYTHSEAARAMVVELLHHENIIEECCHT